MQQIWHMCTRVEGSGQRTSSVSVLRSSARLCTPKRAAEHPKAQHMAVSRVLLPLPVTPPADRA